MLTGATLPLVQGTSTYNDWVEPPVPIYFQIWVYDVINPEEVVNKGERPAVVQKGPYTYREKRHKQNITSYDNGTIAYRETRTFIFDRAKSVGPETDNFTTANILMVTIADLLEREYSFIQELAEIILDIGGDSNLFTTLSVRGIMWGYEDPLLKTVNDILKRYNQSTIDDHFGLFYKQNGTDDGLYTIDSGTKSVDHFVEIQRWNGENKLSFWTTPTCNMINGTDGTLFPPFVDKSQTLYIFSSDICRSIYTTFHKDDTLRGIDLLEFRVPPNVFLNVTANPANTGFCTPADNCFPSGLLNVASCRSGAPVIMSQPNFLAADPKVIDSVVGVHPDPEQHSTLIAVEPMTGVVMNAQKKLQVNILIKKINHIRDTRNLKLMFFPILWLNESAVITEKAANDFKSAVQTPLKITQAVQYGLIIIGAFILICTLALIIKNKFSYNDEDDEEVVKCTKKPASVNPSESTKLLS
ncbi:hypothetical protein FSP39_011128 [Pinctada imbricata]|uniref:Uncharacterized protein n=1 Tax=Pinctada imbricata TaxID=66713 RepID=A0AA88Y745_PINIB|nr:hypothetical protein FSP39_011128 [Pinctada imbricata]